MAEGMPPNTRHARAEGEPQIEKSAVEARQGRRGRHVLIILVVSLALIAIAYTVIYLITPKPAPQTDMSPRRPISAAATPVMAPTRAPAIISLSQ